MPRRVNLIPVDPAMEPVGSRWNPIDLTPEPEPEMECFEEISLRTPPQLPRLMYRYSDYNEAQSAYVAATLELEEQRRLARLEQRVRRRLTYD